MLSPAVRVFRRAVDALHVIAGVFHVAELTPRPRFGVCMRLAGGHEVANARLQVKRQLDIHLGGGPFQRRVWAALRAIPAGTTLSYGELARALERPTASRAVGHANGSNPVGIVVPCHRVIGADGRLTGYAGGLERKRWLLAHERALPEPGYSARSASIGSARVARSAG